MSDSKKVDNEDVFPDEQDLDEKYKLDSLETSEREEDSELAEETLFDLMNDFFVNENGDNIATVLTGIQNSIDQNSKCILKLTKVIQEYIQSQNKK